MLLLCNMLLLQSQQLTYTRLTNGLNTPEFEGGRTDFCMDDIDMDGHVDILTVGDHGSPIVGTDQHGICVWFGDGQGNFENHMTGNFGYGGIAVGDVNGDGLKDVGYGIHHNYSSTDLGDQILEVALGDGTGLNWTPWDDGLATNGEDWGMFGTDFGDVDNDGDLDLVSISFGSGAGVHVYLNQGDGTWVQSFGFLNGNSDNLVEFADFNNDGNLDFAAAHEFGTAWFGDGSGNFNNNDTGLPQLGAYDNLNGISTGDVNNDGADDLAFVQTDGSVEVFIWSTGLPPGWVEFSGDLPDGGGHRFTDLADMNSDGFLDLVTMSGPTVKIFLGDGAGNWTEDAAFDLSEDGDAKAFRAGGDLDGNGRPDLVLLAETGSWPSYQNKLFCYKESSPADSLWIKPLFPKGHEKLNPGSAHFIEWAAESSAGSSASVTIEISAYGPDGPWWMLAENLPDNGRHQWTVPNYGSENVYLKFTVSDGQNTATSIMENPFTIIGSPTAINKNENAQPIRVYPNPGLNRIYFSGHRHIQQFRMMACNGHPVKQRNENIRSLGVDDLPAGIYFYEIETTDGVTYRGKWLKINP